MTRRWSRRAKQKLKKQMHLIFTGLLWLSLAGMILFLPPNQVWRIVVGFILVFLTLTASLFLISSALINNLIISLGAVLVLLLQYLRQLTWVNGGILFLFVLVVYFLARKTKTRA